MRAIYEFFEQDSQTAAVARAVFSVACALLLWQLLLSSCVESRFLLVPPMEVAKALVNEVRLGAMWPNAVATVTAVGPSFVVSVALGIFVGLALSSSRLSMTTGPVLSALNSVPIIALAPSFIAWDWGLSRSSCWS